MDVQVLALGLGRFTGTRIPTRPGQVKSYPRNEASPSVALELDFASKVWDIGSSKTWRPLYHHGVQLLTNPASLPVTARDPLFSSPRPPFFLP